MTQPFQPQVPIRQAAFTLIEMLVACAILSVLLGLIMPVAGMITRRSHMAHAMDTVRQLSLAMDTYAQEDPRHRYPPVASDQLLRSDPTLGTPGLALDALSQAGYATFRRLATDPADGLRVLVDPWSRPYRYALDDTMDGVIARPAPRLDWNARGLEPFAYVWSLGAPHHGASGSNSASANSALADPDAVPAESDAWIYVRTTP